MGIKRQTYTAQARTHAGKRNHSARKTHRRVDTGTHAKIVKELLPPRKRLAAIHQGEVRATPYRLPRAPNSLHLVDTPQTKLERPACDDGVRISVMIRSVWLTTTKP
eukprot:6183037-Pleurochrysis_carterae.AAC.2